MKLSCINAAGDWGPHSVRKWLFRFFLRTLFFVVRQVPQKRLRKDEHFWHVWVGSHWETKHCEQFCVVHHCHFSLYSWTKSAFDCVADWFYTRSTVPTKSNKCTKSSIIFRHQIVSFLVQELLFWEFFHVQMQTKEVLNKKWECWTPGLNHATCISSMKEQKVSLPFEVFPFEVFLWKTSKMT